MTTLPGRLPCVRIVCVGLKDLWKTLGCDLVVEVDCIITWVGRCWAGGPVV